MKNKIKKSFVLVSILFSVGIFALAFMPHHTCACPQYEDGSYLTHFINKVSKKIIGKHLIEENKKPIY